MRFRPPSVNVQDSSAPQAEVKTYAPGSTEEALRLAQLHIRGGSGPNLAVRQRNERAKQVEYAVDMQRTQQAIQRRIQEEKRRQAEEYAKSFTGRVEASAGKYGQKLVAVAGATVGGLVGGPAGAVAGYTAGEAAELAQAPKIPEIKFDQPAYATPAEIVQRENAELVKSLSYSPTRAAGGNVVAPREARSRAENAWRPPGLNPHSAPDFSRKNWDI